MANFYSRLIPLSLILFCCAPSRAEDLATILGVTHSNGKYYLTKKDYLDEGADQVLATRSRVIKLNLNDSTPAKYPWNSEWPKDFKSLVELAQTSYFKSVFNKPFCTYILTTYSIGPDHHYWLAGMTADDDAREMRQFYDLTKYLLTMYRGTGKTFVLANWEGDWALRDREKNGSDYSPKQPQIDAMIRWFNARMAGIRKARDEVRDTDVHVYGAAEANRVLESIAGKPGVTNSVLPHTTVDLASYSSWDSETDVTKLAQAVDFLAANLPSTAVFGQSTKSVYLGEFGAPENLHPERVDRVIDNVLDIIETRHIPWAIYWEIYCNEPKDKATTLPLNGHNDAMKGFWMIKPDGTFTPAWHPYRELIITSDPDRATAAAIKRTLKLIFEEKFDRPDGTDIGPGWKQSAHYGPISGRLHDHRLEMTMADGSTIPWSSATLDVTNPAILGRGLNVGEYFEVELQRLTDAGALGVELYDSDQLRQGAGNGAGTSALQAWNGITWVPFGIDDKGAAVTYDWTKPHALGVRFDSADGNFATFSYYIDDHYAGSWPIKIGWKSLDRIGVFAQSRTTGSRLQFTRLTIYGRAN